MSSEPYGSMIAQVRSLLEAAWRDVGNCDGWSLSISMPFPQRWDNLPTPLVWYGYADRMVPGLLDGIEVASAWARVVCDLLHSPTHVTLESPRIQLLGIQGIRPLTSSEINAAKSRVPVAELLSEGRRTAELRAVYQFWRKCHGCFFNSIADRHADFVAWLEQPES